MSIFEITMLVCFGAAWPFSIYKSIKSKNTAGKSLIFLAIIAIGYIAGITHKLLYHLDFVIILYIANLLMVLIDIGLYIFNSQVKPQKSIESPQL